MLIHIKKVKYILLVLLIIMAGVNIALIYEACETPASSFSNPFTGNIIYIQPLGDVEIDKLLITKEILENNFNKGVHILPHEKLKRSYLSSRRGQYEASKILSWAKNNIPENAFRHIVVVDEDIYTSRFNFIFGQAEIRGKACVISFARFADQNRALEPHEGRLFRRRITNLLNHELGHTMSLRHCQNTECVMQFANSMVELDNQPIHYCRDCLNKLRWGGALNAFSETGDAVVYLHSQAPTGDISGNQIR